MEGLIGSFITGILALVGVVITVASGNGRMQAELKVSQAVTKEQIAALTREVREHNSFATRIPLIEEQMKTIERRIVELEEKYR